MVTNDEIADGLSKVAAFMEANWSGNHRERYLHLPRGETPSPENYAMTQEAESIRNSDANVSELYFENGSEVLRTLIDFRFKNPAYRKLICSVVGDLACGISYESILNREFYTMSPNRPNLVSLEE